MASLIQLSNLLSINRSINFRSNFKAYLSYADEAINAVFIIKEKF